MAKIEGFHIGDVINFGWICNVCQYSNPLGNDLADMLEHAHCIKCGNMITVSRYLWQPGEWRERNGYEEGETEHQRP